MAESDGDRTRGRVPASVRWAAAIVALQGLVVLALGPIGFVGGILLSVPQSLGRALAEVLIAIAAGVLILFLARSVWREAGWSRAPVVVIQILAAAVGASVAFQAGKLLFGLPILATAAVVLYLLFTPESNLAFFRDLRR